VNSAVMPWLGAALIAAALGALIASGSSWGAFAMIALLTTTLFVAIAYKMRSAVDHDWLVKWVMLGFLAKIVGTLARYYMVAVLYGGGDSYRYYRAGTDLATQFRTGYIPELAEQSQGGFGTQITEYITGGLFTIFTPDMVGGFLIFSAFAFGGQLLLYAAFRRWAGPGQLKPYAFLVLFLPTYFFWPSSIGKDALVLFAMGGAAYFISRTLGSFEIRWLMGLAAFLGILGLIRIHIAGLIVGGLIAAGVIAKMPKDTGAAASLRRLVVVGGFVAAGGLVLVIFPDIFGVDLTGADSLDSFTSDVVRRTSETGTVAAGGAVTGPEDIPGAVALVLFRPFAFEASELQHFFAAAETTLLLGLTLWKLPAMLRNWRAWRANGYVVFSTFYVVGFAIAFSVVRNLGIIARQRGQVLAFFLCVLVALGWERGNEEIEADDIKTAKPSSTPRPAPPDQRPVQVR
jgi:hypothetical protein